MFTSDVSARESCQPNLIIVPVQNHSVLNEDETSNDSSLLLCCVPGTVKPHHAVTGDGVVLGYSHLGMLAAARWLMGSTKSTLIAALQQNPGYTLKIVGETRAVAGWVLQKTTSSNCAAGCCVCPAVLRLDLWSNTPAPNSTGALHQNPNNTGVCSSTGGHSGLV